MIATMNPTPRMLRNRRRASVLTASSIALLLATSASAAPQLLFQAVKLKTGAGGAAAAPTAASKKLDPRTEALIAWLEGFFVAGAGETSVDQIAQIKIPGYRLVRANKSYTADPRANDQCYAALEESGKSGIVGDVFIDEVRMKTPSPINGDGDLDGMRAQLKRYFRGPFRLNLDPASDRLPAFRGVKIRSDTGYGFYDIGGYLKADDGSLLLLGRSWDRARPLTQQRRELMKLDGAPFTGPADATVTIVEYSDMQCAYCKKRSADFEQLTERLAPLLKIKRYFKSFPLTNEHPWAFRAASAGRCFYESAPNLFLRWKAAVYAKQEELTVPALDNFTIDFAAANEIPEEKFKSCYLNEKANGRVLADLTEGFALRVRSTPTYFVDGVPVSWFSDNLMEEYLRKTFLKGAGLPLPTPVVKPAAPGPAGHGHP
ncbi:MAG: thioredoxin domain-containing protein [Thermoanaerobaculia bacterium]